MPLSRPRLQVVQNDEISGAIATIRKYRPGLINDSMVVTSALIEHALMLELDKSGPEKTKYQTPYSMTIVRITGASYNVGIFQFLIRNLNRIAAIFAHIDNESDEFMDYVSRGEKPVYTFVLKGRGFTDFEFVHVATCGSLFEECLTLLVLDFKHHCDNIGFHVLRTTQFSEKWGQKMVSEYVPSLDEMSRVFFINESYLFGGGGGKTAGTCDLAWEADSSTYRGVEIRDTRYIDYSHALVGLKTSSLKFQKYSVETLVASGILTVDRNLLSYRYRCICDGWEEEQQNLDLYELGCIFRTHFGRRATFSPARFLDEITCITIETTPNATVYIEDSKRIEVLPMNWEDSWFTCYVSGKSSSQGWSILHDDANPFKLYDMNDFFPKDLERYKKNKKKPKQ